MQRVLALSCAIAVLWSPCSVQSVCPYLFDGTPAENRADVPSTRKYRAALNSLDVADVFNDLYALMSDSQDCWPADTFGTEQHYGPLFIRLAWHCSGSFRATDGLGGCAGGRMRFQPESSWDDNTNLDKARALLGPIKEKHGDALSWGDLMVFAGTAAIINMGGPVDTVCAGRIDEADGTNSLELDDPDGLCEEQGNCQAPLGSSTVGLIYVNPAGFMGDPTPSTTAPHVREVFSRMGMNDTETVALIGGGHAFGKCHGACTLGPGENPAVAPEDPWPGNCGTGVAEQTFTSGFEGAWTSYPTQWDNEYFEQLVDHDYTLRTGPGGNYQWENNENGLLMLTADLALVADEKYLAISKKFAEDIGSLNTAFAAAWSKLVTSGDESHWANNRFCVSGDSLGTEYNGDSSSSSSSSSSRYSRRSRRSSSSSSDDSEVVPGGDALTLSLVLPKYLSTSSVLMVALAIAVAVAAFRCYSRKRKQQKPYKRVQVEMASDSERDFESVAPLKE